MPVLRGFALSRTVASRGDTLNGVIAWQAPLRLAPGSYRVAMRFDRALPADVRSAPAWLSKPWRKLVERAHHERYRFRADHLPANGDYGVDAWGRHEVVRDSFEFVVPEDVAPGDYEVQVTMTHQPHYPNTRLSDWFMDDDFLRGVPVGRLQIRVPNGER